ncbi:MAG TPA: TadE/TadG family type IV pilus assembly protein [Pseudolabrys sp.]|uniref:TadE/TadG family type IV pilus assembly protein n=1 Tax=Pseudolabrys sp. TaxID=1960880 RepID=UPI002DDD9B54|nr:TadE/TadG family type IV pilus assembly protein [Pseudolabrys sp.]HEV2630605.1 TadE/TadG family type IV pilus assembly protein [Pseudolabrys sp.]
MLPIWSNLRRAVRDFSVARSGNVAIIFAIATLPLAGFVGAAIDYSRANAVKAAMQTALDSTALMLSKEATTDTSDQLQTNATKYFNANFSSVGIKASSVTITPVYSTDTPSQITVNGAVAVPTSFVGILGVKFINLNETSTAAWGSTRLRVALVLDNTGSMADAGKMTALKSATSSLLDQLKSAASVNGDVYVSIVPFVKDVSVGACGAKCATWLDFSKDYTNLAVGMHDSTPSSSVGPGSACPYNSWTNGYSCVTAAGGSSTTSSIPSSGTNKGWICPSNSIGCYDSVAQTSTTTKVVGTGWFASCSGYSTCSCAGSGSNKVCTATITTNNGYKHTWFVDTTKWTGCVTDRGSTTAPGTTAGHDQDVAAPDTTDVTTLFPAEQYGACPQTMTGLSYDWTSMKSLVTNMQPNGSTNQPIGLMMGWLSLAGGGPFTVPPTDSNYQYSNIIILLSDGLNTQDRWYGNGSATSTSVDYRMVDPSGNGTCANIKAAGITIYTIQVNTGGDPTSTLLKNCASDTSKFFLLTSASQIVTTFQQIGTNLTQLRVAK